MDFKQFIPDFGAIAKTEWGKPQWGGKQDVIKLIGIIATFAMLTFVLCLGLVWIILMKPLMHLL